VKNLFSFKALAASLRPC